MNVLKFVLINVFAMMSLNYDVNAKKIIFVVNVNFQEWDAILMQIVNKKRHFSRYENNMWFEQKARYDAIKRECRRFLKTLKKIRF